MAKIAVTELCPAGSAFFSESETFLNELTDETILAKVNGGIILTTLPPSYPDFTRIISPIHRDRNPIPQSIIPLDPHSGRSLP